MKKENLYRLIAFVILIGLFVLAFYFVREVKKPVPKLVDPILKETNKPIDNGCGIGIEDCKG